jgi:excisionase family DNA binding protein
VSGHALTLTLPDDALLALAERLAELIQAAPRSEEWIDVDQAAAHLGCNRNRIYYLVSGKRIPHHKEGRRVMFRRSELDHGLASGDARGPD